jgi:hypothetical protein
MSIKLELTFASFEELRKFSEHQVKHPASEKDATPPAAPAKAAKPAPEKAKPAAEEETTDTEEETSDEPTFDDVKDAVLKVNRLVNKEAAKAVLKKFGAEKVGPEIKEKDYAAVIKACNKALAAAN